jgi:hypothetical protein
METNKQGLSSNINNILSQELNHNQITINENDMLQLQKQMQLQNNMQPIKQDYINDQMMQHQMHPNILQNNGLHNFNGMQQDNNAIDNILQQQAMQQQQQQQAMQQQQQQQAMQQQQQQQAMQQQQQQQQLQQAMQQYQMQQQAMQQQMQSKQPMQTNSTDDGIDTSGQKSTMDNVINELKSPCILFVLYVLLSMPIFMELLQKYLPKFGVNEDGKNTYLGIFFRGLLLIVVFASIKRFILCK